jgi:glycine/D-amino acid oxidase-like deaminating enzyme
VNFDYIISGLGIAGSLLHYQLKLKNPDLRILVIDDSNEGSASKVAAGMFNAQGGRAIRKTWNADTLVPYAQYFYSKLNSFLGTTIYSKLPLLRYFESLEEHRLAIEQMALDGLSVEYFRTEINGLNPPKYKACLLKDAGWVDVLKLAQFYKLQLKKNNELIEDSLEIDDYGDSSINTKFGTTKNLIFTQGYRLPNFFEWLPILPNKGELIHFKSELLELDILFKQGIYIIPKGNNEFIAGATYEWKTTDGTPSEKGKSELIKSLNEIIEADFEVILHLAGIRPASPDRRPIMGTHPKNKNIHIFSGLGTKGVLYAPYYSDIFSDYLLSKKLIPLEVNLDRFLRKYYKE